MGRLDADGNLYLLGRKKELLITSGGVKLHPESIEQELNNNPDVVHSVIFIRPDAAHLTCVVDLAAPAGDEAKARITKFVNSLPAAKKAAPFVEVVFADEPFTTQNGCCGPI